MTREELEIGETLEIIEKTSSEQNFIIFSDSESVPKRISNTSARNIMSHITLMIEDKVEGLASKEKAMFLDPGALRS